MVAAVPVVCPNCDVVPSVDSVAGAACAACGMRLVTVEPAAATAPPKPAVRIGVIAVAIVAIVAIVTVVVVIVARTPSTPPATTTRPADQQLPATATMVSIEVRSRPRGAITFDGHRAGTTPLTVHVPKATRSIEIGATLAGHHRTRTVIPDHDQTIDFTYP
jgi:PEGA domain